MLPVIVFRIPVPSSLKMYMIVPLYDDLPALRPHVGIHVRVHIVTDLAHAVHHSVQLLVFVNLTLSLTKAGVDKDVFAVHVSMNNA